MTSFFGSLPGEWRTSPLKFVTTFLGRGVAPSYVDDGPVHVVNQAVNRATHLDWSKGKFHGSLEGLKVAKSVLRESDIVINSTGKGTLGRVGYFSGSPDGRPVIADGHVTVVRTRSDELLPRYGFYVMSSSQFYDFMYSSMVVGSTNQIELSREGLGSAVVPLPGFDDQRRIAAFLDDEVSVIDKIIVARLRQVGLLEKRNQSAVLAAIRGQCGSGEFRDSGIRWLGEVPADWPVAAVSHQFESMLGKMLNESRTRGERLRPYLRNVNVQWDEIDSSDLLLMDFPEEERRRYEVKPGDLLVCEGGEPGRCAIWRGDVSEIYYQKALHRVRPRGYSSLRWLFYCMRAATAMNAFAVEGNVTTIAHLTGEQLRAQRFPFPSREVQDRIVGSLDRELVRSRDLVASIKSQISLLEERKRALITAAVTGQIDVTTARGADVS